MPFDNLHPSVFTVEDCVLSQRAPSPPHGWSRRLPLARRAGRYVMWASSVALPLLLSATGAWFAFQAHVLHDQDYGSTGRGFIVAALVLGVAWRLARSRRHGMAIMAAWYLGAASAMPLEWAAFFGGGLLTGILAWIAWAGLMSLPYGLAPRARPSVGLPIGLLLTALPPLGFLGLGSPLLAAGALFPGLGWLGFALAAGLSILPALPGRWPALLAIVAATTGAVRVAFPPAASAPSRAWAMTRFDGSYPSDLVKQFARQDAIKASASEAISQGARLVLLPEGAIPNWDAGSTVYWDSLTELAAKNHAQVLVGAYRNTDAQMLHAQDGLLDLGTGRFFPSAITIPFGMWRPWSATPERPDFPLDLSALSHTIPTRYGRAAYTICYEELLPWPLAAQMLHDNPTFIISAANQWFTNSETARAQSRSIEMQARLWGLPLVRAVNWAPMR